MRYKKISEALGNISTHHIQEAAEYHTLKKKVVVRKHIRIKWGLTAACFALVMIIGMLIINSQQDELVLSNASAGVIVKHIDDSKIQSADLSIESSMSLTFGYTEEELFSKFNTSIFKGTVTKIDNYEIIFNGYTEYRAVVEIAVEKVYRGDCKENETVAILLPCPVVDGSWVEDTETVSAMRVGMTGIFMPTHYDENSYMELNGARVAWRDLAKYGLVDGYRYAFLKTDKGLVFARDAYESIAEATTLEEVEEYVTRMIEDSK